MRKPRRFDERLQDRRQALEQKRARIAEIQSRQLTTNRIRSEQPATDVPNLSLAATGTKEVPRAPSSDQPSTQPFSLPHNVASGPALTFYDRTDPTIPRTPEPWTRRLTELALQASGEGSTILALIWPAPLQSIVPIHALANLELNLAANLRGMRSLLFPATYTSGADLNAILVNRRPFGALYLSLCDQKRPAASMTACTSMRALLASLNYIEAYTPELAHPSLAELIPTFTFNHEERRWSTHEKQPLERTLRRVTNLSYRRDLRSKISAEWAALDAAPDALLVLHNTAVKSTWKAALCALQETISPSLFLLDATGIASQRNYKAVQRIPEFLKVAREWGKNGVGALVLTDDPKTFFKLRQRLGTLEMPVKEHVLPAEYDGGLLSATPRMEHWLPDQRSNSHVEVGIVDREASGLAMSFFRLSHELEDADSQTPRPLHDSALFLLRLSNLPAGYQDLGDALRDGQLDEFTRARHSWLAVQQSVVTACAYGPAARRRPEIEKLQEKSRALIDSWSDGTPMAARMRKDIESRVADKKIGTIALVLPNRRYIALAERYLSRKFAGLWGTIAPRIEWHTLSTVGQGLSGERRLQHMTFVGLNRNVLRILLAHPHVPHGTVALIAFREAKSLLETLHSMKTLDPLKAYRGRIGLLLLELEKRLKDFGNAVDVSRIGDLSLLFSLQPATSGAGSAESDYFVFELDGGERTYSAGHVFQFDSNEDPPFHRVAASKIEVGDLIFNMSDSLKAKVEDALRLTESGISSFVDPIRALVKLYHDDIQYRSRSLFNCDSRKALARELHSKMVELDPSASECRVERVYYWLSIDDDVTAPHASSESRYFKTFCRALGINDLTAVDYWRYVKGARTLSQFAGRLLAARYSEILFHPESAMTSRQIPESIVKALQQEALRCVFKVEHIIPPAKTRGMQS